jgi:type II secretory pathway pseudopilin PulG
MRAPAIHPQSGFTYLGLMAIVVILGILLTTAVRVWSTVEQHEREIQLLWVGHAYRMAIASYFVHGHQYPQTLQQLLVDDRTPVPLHHLRSLYVDPMTGTADWTLIMTPSGTGIMGVVSSSQATPLKRRGFDIEDAFNDTDCYCSWRFVYYANRYLRTWGEAATAPATPAGAPGQPSSPSPLKSFPLTPSPLTPRGGSPPPEPPTTP